MKKKRKYVILSYMLIYSKLMLYFSLFIIFFSFDYLPQEKNVKIRWEYILKV